MGEIPSEFGNLSKLETLMLSQNSLSGTIPSTLGQLENLRKVSFHGTMNVHASFVVSPDVLLIFESEMLDLDYNGLSGTVPKELGNIKYLVSLHLALNELEAIPEEVCA
eukprot:CAMPEP_0118685820 /NCGR_PEP_ID=MMETSP0800-20121206/7466_1 /TAXON_ID=210618 ORGANISM="Striatella unipunctata, Strain CCMP2910" /NCGR_SAMPLE_ID=MMETSP0800 /ASSEMBLY_ACC=CAM_ASM_000638 /LENGTH=108 /DNA_ID=CAMNT_0006582789 /DNA_START=1 /DNA_END=322 /DNA_ORIENTATION=+